MTSEVRACMQHGRHLFTTVGSEYYLWLSLRHMTTTPPTHASLNDLRTAASRARVVQRRIYGNKADRHDGARQVPSSMSHGHRQRPGERSPTDGDPGEGQLLPFLPGPDFFRCDALVSKSAVLVPGVERLGAAGRQWV